MTENHPPDSNSTSRHGDGDTSQSQSQEVSVERAEQLLMHGDITELHGVILWGSNYSALVQVHDSELETTAVYKPQQGERPLWDFPNGTLCYREVASYLVSQALGWQIVPPTVLRKGPHGLGSLQLFIDHSPEVNYFNLDDRFVSQLQRFVIFDFLVNNADRKGGHLLLSGNGKLWGIDHGLTFHALPKLRTVIWEFTGQPITKNLISDIERLCGIVSTPTSPTRQQLESLLSAAEIAALLQRIQHIVEHPIYPEPGLGPNHPWPPV